MPPDSDYCEIKTMNKNNPFSYLPGLNVSTFYHNSTFLFALHTVMNTSITVIHILDICFFCFVCYSCFCVHSN